MKTAFLFAVLLVGSLAPTLPAEAQLFAFKLTGDVTCSDSGTGSCPAVVGAIGGQAVSLGGALTFSGAYSFTATLTGATAVTFPTSGTLAKADGSNATSAALQALATAAGSAALSYGGPVSASSLALGGATIGSNALAATGKSALAGTVTVTPAANTDGIDISGLSLTGSAANAGLSIAGTWNTTGNPYGLLVNIANTASGTNSTLLRAQIGGADQFYVGAGSNQIAMSLTGTSTSSVTTNQQAFNFSRSFNPGGASLNNLYGINGTPTISGSSITISNFVGTQMQLSTTSGFTGTVTTAESYYAATPSIGGTNPFTTYTGFQQGPITNGSGNTSGTITNIGLQVQAPTAVPGAGGTINNTDILISMPSGTNAGTEAARGLYITGNGPTGGTLTNLSIDDESTAQAKFVGPIIAVSYAANGSAPSNSGSCAINTQLGGNTFGSFKANGACAGGTVILTFSTTAPNGWTCEANDLTTTADTLKQTAYGATSCTFAATMAASDLVSFSAVAF